MLTLALNTAEKRVQFLLYRENALLCAQDWLAQRGGTELLVPALEDACRRLRLPVSDISRIACVAGPGGFTGIRLGLATAAALARANQARQAGLDYLQCLAAGVGALPGEVLWVVTHARQGLAYSGWYRVDESGLPARLGDIGTIELGALELKPSLNAPEKDTPDYILGGALPGHEGWFQNLCPSARLLPAAFHSPSPSALHALALAADWENSERDIEPLYIRDCDAVENLDAIATKRGMGPEQAQNTLRFLLGQKL